MSCVHLKYACFNGSVLADHSWLASPADSKIGSGSAGANIWLASTRYRAINCGAAVDLNPEFTEIQE